MKCPRANWGTNAGNKKTRMKLFQRLEHVECFSNFRAKEQKLFSCQYLLLYPCFAPERHFILEICNPLQPNPRTALPSQGSTRVGSGARRREGQRDSFFKTYPVSRRVFCGRFETCNVALLVLRHSRNSIRDRGSSRAADTSPLNQ